MYILEGNIGAGKSTFLSLIARALPAVSVCTEPVDNWQKHVYGQSLLANFYQKPKRWAYTFELLTMIHRSRGFAQEQNNPLHIVERSIYSGFYCFAYNSYKQNFMSDVEWELYKQWFELIGKKKSMLPKGFIYLKASPETTYARIKKRNRYAEKTISLSYLKQIHERHEQFLIKKESVLKELFGIPVLTLVCDDDFEEDTQKFHSHMHMLQKFFSQTGKLFPEYKYGHKHFVEEKSI